MYHSRNSTPELGLSLLLFAVFVVVIAGCSDDDARCSGDDDCAGDYQCSDDGICVAPEDFDNRLNVAEESDAGDEIDLSDADDSNDGQGSDTDSGEDVSPVDDSPAFQPADTDELLAAEQEYGFRQTRTCTPSGFSACEPNEQPQPVLWYDDEISYVINQRGTSDLHDGDQITDEVRDAVIESFDTWSDQDCSGLDLVFDGLSDEDELTFSPDGESTNLVVWRDDAWTNPGYDGVALATVTFSTSTGEIVSADIELNTAEYEFTNSDSDVVVDLRNTVTHEVGHFVGLDHSPHSDATMFATSPAGETSKRELHEADIAGLCFIYPAGP